MYTTKINNLTKLFEAKVITKEQYLKELEKLKEETPVRETYTLD